MNRIVVGNLELSIGIEYDTSTGKVIVTKTTCDFLEKQQVTYKSRRLLNRTDEQYKIICFGTKCELAQVLPQGQYINVIFNGNEEYNARVHSSTKGRIDGLSQLYNKWKLPEGTLIEGTYTPETRTLEIDVVALDYEIAD